MACYVSITNGFLDSVSQLWTKNVILLIGLRPELVFIVTGQLAVWEECDKIIG